MGVSSSNSNLPILLLSLAKIKMFEKELQIIETKNKGLELLNIFRLIISDNNSLNSCSKEYEKLFSVKKNDLFDIIGLYKDILSQINKELIVYKDNFDNKKNIKDYDDINFSHISYNNSNEENKNDSLTLIEELFLGETEATEICLECKKKEKIKKSNIIILDKDLNFEEKDFDIENLFRQKFERQVKQCDDCKNIIEHQIIKTIIRFPKILIIVLKNKNKKNEIKIKFQLKETINKETYNLLSFIINNDEMIYTKGNNWYKYNIKGKIPETETEINENRIKEYNPIIIFYQNKNNLKEHIRNCFSEMFITGHDYAKAIIHYSEFNKKLESDNLKLYENIYLIHKSYFNLLSKIIDVNLNTLKIDDKNIEDTLNSQIRKNRINITEMKDLTIINNYQDITEEIDFIDEEIINDLKIEKENYIGKNITLYKISKNIYKFILKDNILITITIKDKKKIISFVDTFTEIPSNINNNKEINNNLIIKDINVIQDKKEKENKNKSKMKGNKISFSKGLTKLFEQQKKIVDEIKKNIINENEFTEYYIINKIWYNKLSKIFEKEEKYQNDSIIIDSINKISNNSNFGNNELLEQSENFPKRKDKLNDANLFKVEFEDNKKINNIKYPKEFIIIEVNNFELLIEDLNICFNNNIKNNIYKMLLGENYLFVEDNKNKNLYYICKNNNINNILFNVELIIKYNDDKTFCNEIKNYIKNKNGLDYYLKERKININEKQIQKIYENNEEIGSIINISYNNNNRIINDNNNYNQNLVNDNKNENENETNRIMNLNIKANNKEKNNNNINSISGYIKPLFLCLLKIEDLTNYFTNNNSPISQKNSLLYLINKLILQNNKQNDNLSNIINDIEKKIKELNKDITTKLDFKNLIDFILTTLDNELNNYDKEREEFDYEDFDQDLVYRKFQSYYEQESIIQKLFYAHLQITSSYECCKLNKYICKLCKYIYLNIESKEKVTLNSLIYHWENRETTILKFCKMCFLKDKKTLEKKKLNKYPEILIIILNNPNNITINFEQTIKLNDYEYNIITGIIKTQKENSENSFDIIFYNNSKLTIFQEGNNEIKELEEKKINPYALFCRKGNEIKKKVKDNINKEKDMSGKKQKRNHNKENNMKNIGSQNKNNKMMNNNNEINKDKNIHPNNNFNNIAQNNMKNMEQNNNIPNNMNNIFQNNNINNNFPNNINNNIQGNMNIQQNNINNIIQGNMNNNFQQNNMNNNFNNNMNVNQMNSNINMNNNYNNNINNINNNICNNNNINNFNNNYNNNNFNNNPQNFNNNNYNNINPQNFSNNNYNNAINNFPCQSVLINNNMFNNNINMNGMNMQISSPMIAKNIININNNSNNNNLPVSNPVNNINDPNTSKKDENEYVLYFNFSNGKQLYLNVNKFLVFSQVIIELKSKYSWMNALKIKNYTFKKKTLDYNKTVKDNGLSDLSEIDIIEEDN